MARPCAPRATAVHRAPSVPRFAPCQAHGKNGKEGRKEVKQANTVTHLTTDSFTIPPCRAPKPDTKAWCTAMMK